MFYPPHILDEIRARLAVSDVVARKVALKKKGREFAGLSPFKSEKTPSFFVNDQKGFYHCFSSGEHGDIFKFLMTTEGLSFPEAVERLADEAGVVLPKHQAPNPEVRDRRDRLLALMEAATRFFADQLNTSGAHHARTYLERRGLSPETIAAFRIGFAPNHRSSLSQHLRDAGFSDAEIIESGCKIAGADIAEPYDRFRNRITFPITDTRGKVVAFGARALDPDQPAKYLNSPETPLFHKGHLLFNAHRARSAAHEAGDLLVVEGYMDVIALAQAGFAHAVAPLGTALTADQVQLLWRMCSEPTLCFDGDSAGQRAAHRAIDTVLPHLSAGRSLQFAFLPAGADPDDLLREQGPGAIAQVLKRRRTLADVLWEREWQSGDWTTPERRAQLENQLRKLVNTIQDDVVRNHYDRVIFEKLRGAWRQAPRHDRPEQKSYGGQAAGWKRFGAPAANAGSRSSAGFSVGHTASLKNSALVAPGNSDHTYREALLIRTALNHPWLIEDETEELADLVLSSASLRALRDALLAALDWEKNLDTQDLHNHLIAVGLAPNLEQLDRIATHKCDAFAEPGADRATVERGWRHTLALHRQQKLRDQLLEAERDFHHSGDENAMARILELQRLIARIVPKEAAID